MLWHAYFWAFGLLNCVLAWLASQHHTTLPTRIIVYTFVAILLQFALYGLLHRVRFGPRPIWQVLLPAAWAVWFVLMVNHIIAMSDAAGPMLVMTAGYLGIVGPALWASYLYGFRRYPEARPMASFRLATR